MSIRVSKRLQPIRTRMANSPDQTSPTAWVSPRAVAAAAASGRERALKQPEHPARNQFNPIRTSHRLPCNPFPPCRLAPHSLKTFPTPASSRAAQAQANAGRRNSVTVIGSAHPENPGNVASPTGSGSNNGGYRDRDSHQFGNNAGGGFKRKGGKQQQRGPRSFVGPMDHSYRAVNGNFADTPPSTIETHGNYGRSNGGGRNSYQSDSQPIDYSQGRTIPIPENAPTKIFFFIEDLFFIAKIQETARKLGVKIAFVKNDKEAIAELVGGEEDDLPGLIVFDLNNANAKPLTLIPKLKTKLKKHTSIIGFLSHLQGDLKAKAVEAGCDTVMPRAAFSQNLPNLLRRYGFQEEEEQNFNQ